MNEQARSDIEKTRELITRWEAEQYHEHLIGAQLYAQLAMAEAMLALTDELRKRAFVMVDDNPVERMLRAAGGL